MANERTIPSAAPKTVATFSIISDGNKVSDAYHIISITVQKEVNRIPSATIILLDGTPAKESFEISNKADFIPGKDIEIKAGYRSNEETVFKGIVVRHGIKVRKDASVLVIECKDKAVKMTGAVKSKYFKEVKDSDIMEELVENYGLDSDVAATDITHQQMVQYHATDWDFILCRADACGLLCFVNDGKVSMVKPDFDADEALTIQYGATIRSLDAEIDARLQYKTVTASSWDFSGQALLDTAEAEDPNVPDAGNLTASELAGVMDEDEFRLFHSGRLQEPELQEWVNAAMLRHRLAKIRGSVSVDGTADVLPGQLIQLNGVGERFEGKLFVTAVRQQIEKGNWETVFQFGINPEWFAQTYKVQQPLAGALLPAIEGLQIGVVTALEGDPDGDNRIQVRMPLISKNDEGIWCRLSTLDAGENRGSVFRPEIGDEVIVGFINNDPRHAVVLGMLHSSAKPAPLEAADDNNEKGYVSRSDMRMIFNDDEKSISIHTPAGNKIVLSENEQSMHLEDQHGNKIVLDQKGITIESVKDIILKAATELKIDGNNVSVKGGAQLNMEGGASAEMKSGGTTNVKGSLVNIN